MIFFFLLLPLAGLINSQRPITMLRVYRGKVKRAARRKIFFEHAIHEPRASLSFASANELRLTQFHRAGSRIESFLSSHRRLSPDNYSNGISCEEIRTGRVNSLMRCCILARYYICPFRCISAHFAGNYKTREFHSHSSERADELGNSETRVSSTGSIEFENLRESDSSRLYFEKRIEHTHPLSLSSNVHEMRTMAIEARRSNGAIRANTSARQDAYRGCEEARRYARTRSLSWPVVVSTRYGDTAHFMVSRTEVGTGRAFKPCLAYSFPREPRKTDLI